jgi:hypothetical protein
MRTCDIVLAVFSAVVVLGVAAVAVTAVIVDSEQGALERYCVDSGAPANVLGAVNVNSNSREISWDLQWTTLGTISALKIMGPVVPGSATSASTFVSLCGVPSLIGCMDTPAGRRVSGTITQTSPGELSLTTEIAAIRKEPWRYYLQIDTSVTDAEVTAFFTRNCGAD